MFLWVNPLQWLSVYLQISCTNTIQMHEPHRLCLEQNTTVLLTLQYTANCLSQYLKRQHTAFHCIKRKIIELKVNCFPYLHALSAVAIPRLGIFCCCWDCRAIGFLKCQKCIPLNQTPGYMPGYNALLHNFIIIWWMNYCHDH